jgi:transposase-like protein
MKRPRRNHTATYKAKVALAALKGDKTLVELSRSSMSTPSQIVQWKTQLLEGAMGVFLTPAEKRESQGPSLKDMRAKIGQLALENEWKGHSPVEVGDGRCHDADSIHSDQRGPSNEA